MPIVVGYSTREVKPAFRLFSVPFEKVGDETILINDCVQFDSDVYIDWAAEDEEFDVFMDTAPQLQIQRTVDEAKGKEGTYQKYYYVKNALFNDGGVKKYVPGWCDATGKLATPEKTPNFPGIVPVNGGFYARGTGGFTIKYNIAK